MSACITNLQPFCRMQLIKDFDKLEMIMQAAEYEAVQPVRLVGDDSALLSNALWSDFPHRKEIVSLSNVQGLDLTQFFTSTAGRFKTDLGWVH